MDLKETAKKLMKLADTIEKEAADISYFVCDSCNHTASLSEINGRRKKLATEEDSNMIVEKVTINDTISCPACEGKMAYVATDSSEKYYVEAEDEMPSPEEEMIKKDEEEKIIEKPEEEKSKSDEETPDLDIDELFEDVETQAKKNKGEEEDIKSEDTSSSLPPDGIPEQPQENTEDPSDDIDEDMSETPAEKSPEIPQEDSEEDQPEEEDIEEVDIEEKEDKPKKKRKKKDKPDDEKVNLNKEDTPKFKSKEAQDRFAASLERYSL